ncbi:MAG TPA: MBL fold metallo-hydrolase, partial [Nocardioides sp.]|nr:MBL fold metallo-hydrolase [Nocardioides sp.]
PSFDQPGDYPVGARVLTKTRPPRVGPEVVGPVDAVLLSHDQHPDNLDTSGRSLLTTVPLVLTTTTAAGRIEGPARGLDPWASVEVGRVTVTAVPAQHGPDGTEHLTGPVTGFVLSAAGHPTVYVSGDNASLDVVAEISRRHPVVDVAILFAGAARTPLVDGFLTLTAPQVVEAARLLGEPQVLVVHADSWAHFTEGEDDVRAAFAASGLEHLLVSARP